MHICFLTKEKYSHKFKYEGPVGKKVAIEFEVNPGYYRPVFNMSQC